MASAATRLSLSFCSASMACSSSTEPRVPSTLESNLGRVPSAAPPRPRKKKNVADPSGTALYDAEASPGGSKAERKLKLRSPNNRRGENSDPNRFGSAAATAGSGAGLRGAHAQQPGGAIAVIRAHGRRRRGRKGCPNQAWVAQNLPRRWWREEAGPRRPSCAS